MHYAPCIEKTVRFLLPNVSATMIMHCALTLLLVLLLSMQIFQRTLSFVPTPDFWAKAGAKVRKIKIQTKLFNKKIRENTKVFANVDKRSYSFLYYI